MSEAVAVKEKKWQTDLLLVILILYVCTLGVLTLDQVFEWDIYPPEYDQWVFALLEIHEQKDMSSIASARGVLSDCLETFDRTRFAKERGELENEIASYLTQETGTVAAGEELLKKCREESTVRLLDVEDFVSVRIFIKKLKDNKPEIREKSYECLMAVTKRWYPDTYPDDGFGYNPQSPPSSQQVVINSWTEWWVKNKEQF